MRVAHFTDLHLLSLAGNRVRDFVNKRWTGGVNLLLNRGRHYRPEVFDALVDDVNAVGVDQVAVTGDITNLALESEFRFARDRFDRIAAGPENVTCIPGNHDTYIAEAEGLFERTFGDYCSADADWRWPEPPRWPTVRVRGELALIGISTSQPSGWFMGYGSVGPEQLGRLESVLGDPRLADRFRLVLMHHPPAGRHAKSLRRGLHDHQAFAEVIERAGCELILHGHEHLDLREALPGPGGARVPVHGVQSGTYGVDTEKRRARYRIYDIERGHGSRPQLIAAELRTWRVERQAFGEEAA